MLQAGASTSICPFLLSICGKLLQGSMKRMKARRKPDPKADEVCTFTASPQMGRPAPSNSHYVYTRKLN